MSTPKIPSMFWLASRGQWAVKIKGKRVQLGADRLAATAKYHALVRELLGGPPPARLEVLAASPAGVTVLDVLAAYRADLRPMHPSHVWRVDRALELAAAECGQAAARDFGPRLLLRVRAGMVRAGYCRRTCNQMVGCLCTAWGWAVVRELVDRGAAHALREVPPLARGEARDAPRVRPAPDADVESTLPHLGPVVRAMVELQRLTGMRPGEVCAMSRACVSLSPAEPVRAADDLDLAAVVVDGVAVWLYCPDRHKCAWRGLPRVVALGPAAQALLAPFLERRSEAATLFSPRENLVLSGLGGLLAGERSSREVGEAYRVSSYCHAVAAGCARAGVPRWTPNRLRHALATQIANARDVDTARAALGHTSAGMTLNYVSALIGQATDWARRHG